MKAIDIALRKGPIKDSEQIKIKKCPSDYNINVCKHKNCKGLNTVGKYCMECWEQEEYPEITSEEAKKIIESRKPLGTFWLKEGNKFVAIDNSDGEAWTEEFNTKEECLDYLNI